MIHLGLMIRVAKIILRIIGGVSIIAAVLSLFIELSFLGKDIHTNGNVISIATQSGSIYVRPVITYTSFQGQTRQFTSQTGYNPAEYFNPPYRIGQAVSVLYDPTGSFEPQLDNFWDQWLMPITFMIIAAFVLIISYADVIALKVKKKNRAGYL